MPLAAISSPTQSVWHLGSIPIRAYALCIVLGIIAATVVTERRMRQRGAPPNLVLDIVIWAVPAGIVGARIYHVITSPSDYFGADGHLVDAFKIWQGGIGIWGAVLGGAVGAAIACKQLGIPLRFFADALAPGLPLAQAIGRWGNYFNNELYGGSTHLPWGLKVYEFDLMTGQALTDDVNGSPLRLPGLYHPTFLYESLWDLGVAVVVWLLDRRFKFGRGRAFALYGALYCVGRFWIEAMRTDPAQVFLGMRLNNWTALLVFVCAVAYFVRVRGPQERMIVAADGGMTLVPIDMVTPLAFPTQDPDTGEPEAEVDTGAETGAETGADTDDRPADDRGAEETDGDLEDDPKSPSVAATSGEPVLTDNVEAPEDQETTKKLTTDA